MATLYVSRGTFLCEENVNIFFLNKQITGEKIAYIAREIFEFYTLGRKFQMFFLDSF